MTVIRLPDQFGNKSFYLVSIHHAGVLDFEDFMKWQGFYLKEWKTRKFSAEFQLSYLHPYPGFIINTELILRLWFFVLRLLPKNKCWFWLRLS